MNTSTLDKTISIRQILRYTAVLLGVTLTLYVGAFFWIAWENKMGYVPMKTSPYASSISSNCEKFADRHYGTSQNSVDNLLLRRRSVRLNEKNLAPEYGRIRCLGYAVLTGLHSENPRLADFSDIYEDGSGAPIVSIHVTYHQTFRPADVSDGTRE